MTWFLVAVVAGSTVACDLLQSWEMKRQGEMRDFRPRRFAALLTRWPLVLAVAFMAASFFAFLELLRREDLSFAVPVTAASLVLETLLARAVLREAVQPERWLGAVLVACGVMLVARS